MWAEIKPHHHSYWSVLASSLVLLCVLCFFLCVRISIHENYEKNFYSGISSLKWFIYRRSGEREGWGGEKEKKKCQRHKSSNMWWHISGFPLFNSFNFVLMPSIFECRRYLHPLFAHVFLSFFLFIFGTPLKMCFLDKCEIMPYITKWIRYLTIE